MLYINYLKQEPEILNQKINPDRGFKIKYSLYENYHLNNIEKLKLSNRVVNIFTVDRSIEKSDDVILLKKFNKNTQEYYWEQIISGIEYIVNYQKEKQEYNEILSQINDHIDNIDYIIKFMELHPKYANNLYYRLSIDFENNDLNESDLENILTTTKLDTVNSNEYDIITSGINYFGDKRNFELKYECGKNSLFRLDIVQKIDTKFITVMGYYKVVKYQEYFVGKTKKHLFFLKRI